MGGIYKISCAVNRHVYVGAAKDFQGRWVEHRQMLMRNRHFNIKMQAAWNRYGDRQFAFEVIEHIGEYDLAYFKKREGVYIDAFRDRGVLMFNPIGVRVDLRTFDRDKIALKISNALRYKASVMSVEDRKRMWGNRLGCRLSDEHRKKTSEGMKGIRRSVETRRRMSLARIESFKDNPERRNVMSEVGRKNVGRVPINAVVYIVDGVEYESGSSAMRALGISSHELYKWVRYGRASRKEKG